MNYNIAAWAGDSIGEPAVFHSYGPFTIDNPVKITRVKATYNVNYSTAVVTTDTTFVNWLVWGVQAGATGYTPVDLPGGLGATNFFWAKLMGQSGINALAWAPSSDSAGYTAFTQDEQEWHGQQAIGETVDLWVTSAGLVEGSAEYTDTWTLQVVYIT